MKLVTFRTANDTVHAGVVRNDSVLLLTYPTLLELLQDPKGMTKARQVLVSSQLGLPLNTVTILPPVPNPPTLRDLYEFEQHVKAARAKRGLNMIPEW